jgi:Fic family protein
MNFRRYSPSLANLSAREYKSDSFKNTLFCNNTQSGEYRDILRNIYSGAFGHQKVHYQAPPAKDLEKEINQFLNWFNQEGNSEPVLKALIAHLS